VAPHARIRCCCALRPGDGARDPYGRLEGGQGLRRRNGINRIALDTSDAWLGLVAAARRTTTCARPCASWPRRRRARPHGIRILKVGMLFPWSPASCAVRPGAPRRSWSSRRSARRELFVRDVLYNDTVHPRVVGKRASRAARWSPPTASSTPTASRSRGQPLERKLHLGRFTARVALLEALRERPQPITLARQPYSARAARTTAHDGAGRLDGRRRHRLPRHACRCPSAHDGHHPHGRRGRAVVGMAPFSNMPHIFRTSATARSFIPGSACDRPGHRGRDEHHVQRSSTTPVAMTGGQDRRRRRRCRADAHAGGEGVRRIIVMTDEPPSTAVAPASPTGRVCIATASTRAEAAARHAGVTALVYDQRCAAEKRRLRKRGGCRTRPAGGHQRGGVRGCGDCGVKSNCLSVHLGRDRVRAARRRSTSVLQHGSRACAATARRSHGGALGEPKKEERARFSVDRVLPELSEGSPRRQRVHDGIGARRGEVNQLLGTRAVDGKHVRGLDQTGLSQKGAPVVSHLKISEQPSRCRARWRRARLTAIWLDVLVATASVNSITRGPTDESRSCRPARYHRRHGHHTDVPVPEAADCGRPSTADPRTRTSISTRWTGRDALDDHMAATCWCFGAAYQAAPSR